MASERLRDPRSVSLADVNNPRDLAEMFSECFKHEWAEAYEELNKTYRDPTETIKHLLLIIKVSISILLLSRLTLILQRPSNIAYSYGITSVLQYQLKLFKLIPIL